MKEKILSIFWIYYIISGVYIILLLFIFDAVSQVYPMLGIFGTITWYLSYLYIIIFALVSFFKIVKSASLLKTPFSLITIIFFITLIFIRLDNPKSLSAEASIEISCGINQLTTTPDFGYNQTCMFGYPARQYFLPALTTFLFGRNIVSINSGNAIYFILGLIIFSSGILELYSHSFKGDLINSILIFSFMHLFYFNHFLFIFEQGIYPLSFALMLTGLALYYFKSRKFFILVPFGILLYYLIFSYTTSLSLFILALGGILYSLITDVLPALKSRVFSKGGRHTSIKRSHKIFLFLLFLITSASFLISLAFRNDLNLVDNSTRTGSQLINDLELTFKYIMHPSNNKYFISPILTYPIAGVIILSLLFIFGKTAFFISVWSGITLIVSVISQGYYYYDIDFRPHRALVIFPILFGLIAYLALKAKSKYINLVLFVLFILISASGAYYNLRFYKYKAVNEHYPFIAWMQERIDFTKHKGEYVYLTYDAYNYYNLISLYDDTLYFTPEITTVVDREKVYLGNDCMPTDLFSKGFIVVPDTHQCYLVFNKQANSFNKIGDFKLDHEENYLGVFRKI